MIQGVSLDDMIQLPKTETEKMVQCFSLKAADPGFDIAICDGRLAGRLDNATIISAKILVKALAEFAVTIMNQEPHINPFILGPHAHVSGLLLHPFTRGIAGTW